MVGFESLQVCFVCMRCIIARTFIYITAVGPYIVFASANQMPSTPRSISALPKSQYGKSVPQRQLESQDWNGWFPAVPEPPVSPFLGGLEGITGVLSKSLVAWIELMAVSARLFLVPRGTEQCATRHHPTLGASLGMHRCTGCMLIMEYARQRPEERAR